jgi:hypothetical protein
MQEDTLGLLELWMSASNPKRIVVSFETIRPAEMRALCIMDTQELNLTR